jgi:hypothetical protein
MKLLFLKDEANAYITRWKNEDATFLAACSKENYIPFFRFIDHMLKNPDFDKRSTLILHHTLNIWQGDKPYTLEQAGTELGLTGERVRQITFKMKRQIANKVIKSALLMDAEAIKQQYFNHPLWNDTLVSGDLHDSINKREGTAFTKETVFYILQPFSSWNMRLFSFTDKGVDQLFLVHKNALEEVKLGRFVYYIRYRKTDVFEKGVRQMLKVERNSVSGQTLTVLKKLADHYKWQGLPSQQDMANHALKIIDRPASVEAIAETMRKLYPAKKDQLFKGLRTRLLTDKKRFIYTDTKKGNIALKEWEHIRPGVMGGTISDIVAAFLEKENKPVEMPAIVKYVVQYRKTGSKNIREVLKLDTKKRFTFSEKQLVGLRVWQA